MQDKIFYLPFVFSFISYVPFFLCCVQCGLFLFQTKEGFVYSKALAVLLGRLHDCWNNLQPQMYLNFCKCGFKEKLFFWQVGAKQKKAGGRGDVLFLVVFYLSLTRSHLCCSCSDLCNPCMLPIGQCGFPFPFSVIFLPTENAN